MSCGSQPGERDVFNGSQEELEGSQDDSNLKSFLGSTYLVLTMHNNNENKVMYRG